MNKLLFASAIALGALASSGPALAQRVPAATIAVVNSNRAATECNACRTAIAQFRTQGTNFENRRTTLSNQLGPERTAIQTAINALQGKTPDAALQARIKAFDTRAQQAEQELARTQQNLQSINANILRQIKERLDPAVRTVMAARGASVVLEAEGTLGFSPALDVTNDIIAQLNSTLTSISVTPMPQQQQPRPQGR
jgi:outer membrane protein